MDASRKLTVAFGAIALVSTSIAVWLALRPAPAPPAPATAPSADVVPPAPREAGGVNAIAAKALADGGPRTVTAPVPPGAPRRAVGSFRGPLTTPGVAWGCVGAAGNHALTHLDTGGTFDGMADPVVKGACATEGADVLEGFVRLSVGAQKPGTPSTTCEATVSYAATRAGVTSPKREVRAERVDGVLPENCAASLVVLQRLFVAGFDAP